MEMGLALADDDARVAGPPIQALASGAHRDLGKELSLRGACVVSCVGEFVRLDCKEAGGYEISIAIIGHLL